MLKKTIHHLGLCSFLFLVLSLADSPLDSAESIDWIAYWNLHVVTPEGLAMLLNIRGESPGNTGKLDGIMIGEITW